MFGLPIRITIGDAVIQILDPLAEAARVMRSLAPPPVRADTVALRESLAAKQREVDDLRAAYAKLSEDAASREAALERVVGTASTQLFHANGRYWSMNDRREAFNSSIERGLHARQWATQSRLGLDDSLMASGQTLTRFFAHAGDDPNRGSFVVALPKKISSRQADHVVTAVGGYRTSEWRSGTFVSGAPINMRFHEGTDRLGDEVKPYFERQLRGLESTVTVSYPRRDGLKTEANVTHRVVKLIDHLDAEFGPVGLYGPPGEEDAATAIFPREGIALRGEPDAA